MKRKLNTLERATLAVRIMKTPVDLRVPLPNGMGYEWFMIIFSTNWREFDFRLGKGEYYDHYSKNNEYITEKGCKRGLLRYLDLKEVKA